MPSHPGRRPRAGSSGPQPPSPRVDLHGLWPEEALRRLALELHAARVRGATGLLVITGAGHGNRRGEPALRTRVEAWLTSDEGRAQGVRGFERVARGGALELRLGPPRPS